MARPKKEVTEENIERFQRELELVGDKVGILLVDKKGRSKSCLLCRRRKQKCDHKLPSCTSCLKAGVKCVQPERYSTTQNDNTTNKLNKEKVANCKDNPSMVNEPKGKQKNQKSQSPFVETKGSVSKPKSKKKDHGDKDEYTLFLEKKLKYLEKLIDIPPTSVSFGKKLSQYKKISNLLGDIGDLEPLLQHIHTNSLNNKNNNPALDGSASIISTNPHDQGSIQHYNSQNYNTMHAASPSYNQVGILPPLPDQSQPKFTPLIKSNSRNMEHGFQRSIRSESVSAGILGETPKPYNGFSPISNNIHSVVNQYNRAKIPTEPIDFSKCFFAKYNLKEFYMYDPAFDFDEQLSRSFLDIFFTRLQFKYPLLDEHEIYQFHESYLNNNIYSIPEDKFHFCCGRMWLIFSISACLHMTTGKYQGLPPERYFSAALRHITRCSDSLGDVQKIELLTLLILYLIRTDRDTLILYNIIKDIMDLSKKLQLNKLHPNDSFVNKKLRLFWCVYLLERMICVAVGRPFTISEAEVDLPLFDENSFNTSGVPLVKGKSTGVHFINQTLILKRLESNFVEHLKIIPQNNLSKEELANQLPYVKQYFHDLELWRASCSRDDVRNFENETLKLYYYRSVRLLIQPYLEILKPEERLFRECQAAAGQICQLYKIFHQKTVYGHSTPAVHTVFVAGVTLIYCMWLARNSDDERRRKLGDGSKHTRPLVSASLFSIMDDLRACSISLYVMTERSIFARTFRDTFDQLMNATIGNLIERCGPDSSELIYISSGDSSVLLANDINGHTKRIENVDANTVYISPNEKNDDIISNNSKINRARSIENSPNDINEFKQDNGLPPATHRRFGRRNDEEFIGMAEGTPVDAETEKEFKKKQSFLEKNSIPKGLSHLLDHTSSNENEDEKPTLVNSDTKLGANKSVPEVTQQFIVKKPIGKSDLDWQSKFEKQAFLQQKSAQENLQVYLSTLNHPNGFQTTSEQARQFSAGHIGLQNDQHLPNQVSSSIAYNPDNSATNIFPVPHPDQTKAFVLSASNSDYPLNNGFNHGSPTNSVSSQLSFMRGLNHLAGSRIPNSNTIQHPIKLGSVTTPIPVTDSILASSDILFKSGTHGMINNISNWTNDSIIDLINNKGRYSVDGSQQASKDNNKLEQNNFEEIPDSANTLMDTSLTNSNISNNNVNNSADTNTHSVTNTKRVDDSLISQQNEHANMNSSSTDKNSEIKKEATHLLDSTWNSNSLVPVEEFWTVNYDYGFLT